MINLNLNIIKIFCDGGSRGNPGPSACAFVVKNNNNLILYQEGKYLGKLTNNLAEYNGVILALNWLKNNYSKSQFVLPTEAIAKVGSFNIQFFIDSLLVVSQLNGKFKIKNAGLRELIFKIKILEQEISTPLKYIHIPRHKNYQADLLVNKILDQQE